jgi:hypothetical protein
MKLVLEIDFGGLHPSSQNDAMQTRWDAKEAIRRSFGFLLDEGYMDLDDGAVITDRSGKTVGHWTVVENEPYNHAQREIVQRYYAGHIDRHTALERIKEAK